MLLFGRKFITYSVLLISIASCGGDDTLTADGGVLPGKKDASSPGNTGTGGKATGGNGPQDDPNVGSGGIGGDDDVVIPMDDAGDTIPAENCGNGQLDQGEQCDGDLLNDATCETLGYTGGQLTCDDQCQYNDTMCENAGVNPGYGDAGPLEETDASEPTGTTTPDGRGIPTDHCLYGIDSYASNGPFTYRTTRLGATNAYIPDVPAGCKVPMVHYSNGTGAMCLMYATILTRLASNGFIALCYENANTGAGTFGIQSFHAALEAHPDLADMRFGSTGHSQGGMAAFNTCALAENEWGDQGIYSSLPMEPASGFGANPREGWQNLYRSINSPVFMFSGLGTDGLVSQGWVQSGFRALDPATEAYFYAKSGANHIATISRDGAEVVVSWFRWTLLGDSKACEYFKAIPDTNPTWSLIDSQNESPCN